MVLTINGTEKKMPEDTATIHELLQYLQLGNKKAVVERNGVIIQKDKHEQEPVEEGDTFEIVHFVGGG